MENNPKTGCFLLVTVRNSFLPGEGIAQAPACFDFSEQHYNKATNGRKSAL